MSSERPELLAAVRILAYEIKHRDLDERRFLWLNHRHEGLYGDDGEMQCRDFDFKRASIETCRAHVREALLAYEQAREQAARLKALEDAAKVLCTACAEDVPFTGKPGPRFHGPGRYCYASAIRALAQPVAEPPVLPEQRSMTPEEQANLASYYSKKRSAEPQLCNVPYQPIGELPGEPPSFCKLRKGHAGLHDQIAEPQRHQCSCGYAPMITTGTGYDYCPACRDTRKAEPPRETQGTEIQDKCQFHSPGPEPNEAKEAMNHALDEIFRLNALVEQEVERVTGTYEPIRTKCRICKHDAHYDGKCRALDAAGSKCGC